MNNGGSIFKGFAGVYVFYQGVQLLIGLKNGSPAFSVPVTILLIICFLGFGGYFLYCSAVDFKREKEAKKAKVAADHEEAETIAAHETLEEVPVDYETEDISAGSETAEDK